MDKVSKILFKDIKEDKERDLLFQGRAVWVLWVLQKSEVAQLCPTLWDPMDCSLPGSSLHGILQARVLEWVVISFSRGSSHPRDRTLVSCILGRRFNLWATREPICKFYVITIPITAKCFLKWEKFILKFTQKSKERRAAKIFKWKQWGALPYLIPL